MKPQSNYCFSLSLPCANIETHLKEGVFFLGRDRYVSKLKMSIGKQFLQVA
jgi:hypothetical protein